MKLRRRRFLVLTESREAVHGRWGHLNPRCFRKRHDESRATLVTLNPAGLQPYQPSVTASANSRMVCANIHELLRRSSRAGGKLVDVRATPSTVGGERSSISGSYRQSGPKAQPMAAVAGSIALPASAGRRGAGALASVSLC